jgi:hypothetical protein
MSIDTFFAVEAWPATLSTSVSSSRACEAVHEPEAASSSRPPFNRLVSKDSAMGMAPPAAFKGSAKEIASEAANMPGPRLAD